MPSVRATNKRGHDHGLLLHLTTIGATVALLPPSFSGSEFLLKQGLWPATARMVTLLVFVPYAAVLIASGSFSPFLYFQF